MKHFGARFGLGLVLFIVGALILLELVANVYLPIVRILVAVLFLLIGARMAVRAWARRDTAVVAGEAVFATRNFSQSGELDRNARFDIVMGRGVVDLTGLVEPAQDITVTIEALFGYAVVKVPPTIAYDIEGSSAFGDVRMPDRSATAMGSLVYRAPSDHASKLHLRINAVFGACQVIEALPEPAIP